MNLIATGQLVKAAQEAEEEDSWTDMPLRALSAATGAAKPLAGQIASYGRSMANTASHLPGALNHHYGDTLNDMANTASHLPDALMVPDYGRPDGGMLPSEIVSDNAEALRGLAKTIIDANKEEFGGK